MHNKIINISKETIFYFGLLAAIFIGEIFLFHNYVMCEITNFFPANFDQSSYLTLIYHIYSNVRQQGIITGFSHSPTLATAVLFPVQSVLFLLFTAPSRFNLLLMNLIYFLILQFCAFQTAKSISGKGYYGLLMLGLILFMDAPFLNSGGLFDFRIDFMAMCLYGIFVTAVLKSQVFLSRKWTLVVLVITTLLVLLRFITSVYLGIIFVSMIVYLLWRQRNFLRTTLEFAQTRLQLINLSILTGIIAIISALYFLWFRAEIYGYYVVGHFTGTEKYIRAQEVGATNFLKSSVYYPHSVIFDHLGTHFFILVVLLLFFAAIINYFCRKTNHMPLTEIQNEILPYYQEGLIFLCLSILVPIFILTLDMNKSPVVGGITTVPCIWLFFWFFEFNLIRKISHIRDINRLLYLVGIMILIMGLFNQIKHYAQHNKVSHSQEITKMYDDIGNYVETKQWSEVYLSIDQICDYITSGGITALYFERQGKWLTVGVEPLGGMIFAINKPQALQSLKQSNVVILNKGEYPEGSPYPFNQSIRILHPFLRQYTTKNFKLLGTYPYEGSVYKVYVKP